VSLRPAVPAAGAGAPGRRAPAWRLPLAIGLVLLGVLGGCAIPGLSPEAPPSGTDASTEPGTGQTWFWYQQGDPVASPSTPVALPAPSSATDDDGDDADPGTDPTGGSSPFCLTGLRANTMYWLNATPGVGQASVTWMSLGGPRVVEYKVAAVLQNRPGGPNPPATWTTVAKPSGCQQMTATVTGLRSGSWYVFWLDVVVTTRPTGLREPMIGRSAAFQVL
jgi:hypothetical protein